MSNMSQLTSLISGLIVPDKKILSEIETALSAAQNPPPHGEADGSIEEHQYAAARSVWFAALKLKRAVSEWNYACKEE